MRTGTYYDIKIGKDKRLPIEEEQEMGRIIYEARLKGESLTVGAPKEARNKLVESHLGFVVSVAQKYTFSGMELPDLVSEGVFGLIKASEKFDVTKGYRFSTYALPWVKHEIFEAIKKRGMNISDKIVYLDAPAGDDSEESIGDYVPSATDACPEDEACRNDLTKLVAGTLKLLSDKEAEILKYRNGFYGRVYTLSEISKMYGLTGETIRRIEKNALKSIRRNIDNTKRLKDYYEI